MRMGIEGVEGLHVTLFFAKSQPQPRFLSSPFGPRQFSVRQSIRFSTQSIQCPVNSDLTESWWTSAIQEGRLFGPVGWTKGGPHKSQLTKFYPKLQLRRALPIYGSSSCESYSYGTMRVKVGALTSIPNANSYIYIYDGWKKCIVLTDRVFMVAPKLI